MGEPFPPFGLVSVVIQPECNFTISNPTIVKFLDGVVEFVLNDEGEFVTLDRDTGEQLPDKWWQNALILRYRKPL